MGGVLISSLCVGTLAAIGLSLLGVRLVAANAVLAGVLNIIPNVGPTLSTLFPMSVALLDTPGRRWRCWPSTWWCRTSRAT